MMDIFGQRTIFQKTKCGLKTGHDYISPEIYKNGMFQSSNSTLNLNLASQLNLIIRSQ